MQSAYREQPLRDGDVRHGPIRTQREAICHTRSNSGIQFSEFFSRLRQPEANSRLHPQISQRTQIGQSEKSQHLARRGINRDGGGSTWLGLVGRRLRRHRQMSCRKRREYGESPRRAFRANRARLMVCGGNNNRSGSTHGNNPGVVIGTPRTTHDPALSLFIDDRTACLPPPRAARPAAFGLNRETRRAENGSKGGDQRGLPDSPGKSVRKWVMGSSREEFVKYPRSLRLFGFTGTDDDCLEVGVAAKAATELQMPIDSRQERI